jgi:hypothetical protein
VYLDINFGMGYKKRHVLSAYLYPLAVNGRITEFVLREDRIIEMAESPIASPATEGYEIYENLPQSIWRH